MAKNPRSQARMLALQAACVFEAVGDAFGAQLADFLHDPELQGDMGFEGEPSSETLRFAGTLARGVWSARQTIDGRLAAAATNWSLERMTPVDRNVLRLGVYELLEQPETPPAVVLDEAVELARRFGDQNSPGFVNGVLDAVRRGLAPTDAPPATTAPDATTLADAATPPEATTRADAALPAEGTPGAADERPATGDAPN